MSTLGFFGHIRLILGGASETDAFGGGPMPYLIIETDDSMRSVEI
jgi:hypothetical protein